jgi:hypothetical protein
MFQRRLIQYVLFVLLAVAAWWSLPVREALAQTSGFSFASLNESVRWSIFALGIVGIILLFYMPIYGLLVKYYHPSSCKQLVLAMMVLYLLGWMSVGAFVFFDYGFLFFWMKWVFVFLAGLWVIWFVVVILRAE